MATACTALCSSSGSLGSEDHSSFFTLSRFTDFLEDTKPLKREVRKDASLGGKGNSQGNIQCQLIFIFLFL